MLQRELINFPFPISHIKYFSSMALCFPSLDDIMRFRVPLEPGESHFLNFLLGYLNDSYEVYVQPFLNGDRPDIVIVRPDAGVLIIEVKDWALRHYANPNKDSSPWVLLKNNASLRSPIAQVRTYKENLYDLHIGSLFERNIKNKNYFSVVQTAVYFHCESTVDARSFCGNPRYPEILGYDSLNSTYFGGVLSRARLDRKSYLFDKDLYKSFRRFLRPPEHTPDIGKELQYTERQQELVKSRANVRQKVRGVAGSGKTKVLAGRAVSAYSRTNSIVLVLTFNITLCNYIHDRISEVRESFPWSKFVITNYHQFFKMQANNYELPYGDLLEAANIEEFFHSVKERIQKYETILIDEVQDYEPEWLRLLVKYFLDSDGELVVYGDEKQNIYGRDMGDDRFPVVPTVPGRWNELKESFRMESRPLLIAQAFQDFYFKERYQIDSDIEVVQSDMFETPAKLKYYGSLENNIFQTIRNEILADSIHPNDLVVLAPTHETIRSLEYGFRNIACERTSHAGERKEEYEQLLVKYNLENSSNPNKHEPFKRELDKIRRGRKVYFWPNAGTVKLSTIYSFKGWEAHTLILVVDNTQTVEAIGSLDELIYTALTRARKNLIIFDSAGLYRPFFSQYLREERLVEF